jgi:nucleotide-binding universal stress UspA family protein
MLATEKTIGLKLENIVVATDFGPAAEAATEYASSLAKHFSSKITLVHVLDLSVASRSEAAMAGWPLEQMREENAENMTRTLNGLIRESINVRAEQPESHSPAAAIVSFTETHDVDLLVMGTTSRHGINSFVFGSCAAEVIHHAKCPVVTLGPKVKKEARAGFHLRKVVFATDLNHQSVEKAGLALAFARESLAKVYLCNVLDVRGTDISNSMYRQLDAEAALRKLVPGPAYEWCTPEFIVEFGNVAERIATLSKRTEADLIVLGARENASHFTHMAKGVVERVLADAECPVMTICAD